MVGGEWEGENKKGFLGNVLQRAYVYSIERDRQAPMERYGL
jgi:hypothetical protein